MITASQQTWIDNILSLAVCSFNQSIPCASVLIKLKLGLSNQLSLDWYCQYAVPVWYELTKDLPPVSNKFTSRLRALRARSFQTQAHQIQALEPTPNDLLSNQALNPPAIATVPYIISELGTNSIDTSPSVPVDADSEWKAFFAS